ncbi:MAG: restriction endonuclease subunit S [Methanophagales archaeon]|nr:restriction endonuclease subunit S [Methanophagales archaeon]
MKPYLKYKDSSVEGIGEIPEHWEVQRGKYVYKEVKEKSEDGSETLLSVSEYYGVSPRREVIEEGDWLTRADSLVGYKICKRNDLIINIMLAWKRGLGVTFWDGIVSPSYSVFRCISDNYDPTYLHYLLRTDFYIAEFKRNSTGIIDSRLRLYPEEFLRINIISPTKSEQQAIANYLDRKTRQIDTLIDKTQKLIDLLKEQRTAIINQAVTKGLNPNVKMKDSGIEWLGKIPEHWEVKRLKYIANVQFSNVDKKSYENEEDVFLCNYLDVYNNEFINSKIGFMKATALPREIEKFSIKYGDVLATKDSETPDDIANAALVTEDFNNVLCGYHLTHIRPDRRFLLGEYLFRLFCAKKFNDQFVVSANGITRYGLSTHSFNSSYISLPPINEQNQIAEYLDKIAKEIDISIENHIKSIKLLQEYRTALISEAVTGKIDVREEVSV